MFGDSEPLRFDLNRVLARNQAWELELTAGAGRR
jgi:hypothetical protein